MGNIPSNCTQGRHTLTRTELDQLCKPSGLYASCNWEDRTVRKLIKNHKLAGRLNGKDDRITGLEQQCPICLLHYDDINTTRCCKATICTECYLQVQNPRERDASCPFCKHVNLAVNVAKRLDGGDVKRREREEQRVMEAKFRQRVAGENGDDGGNDDDNDRGNSSDANSHGHGHGHGQGSAGRINSAGGNTTASSTPTRVTTASSSSYSSPSRSERSGALFGGDQGRSGSDTLRTTLEDLYLLELASASFGSNNSGRGRGSGNGGSSGGSGSGSGSHYRGHNSDADSRDRDQDEYDRDRDRGDVVGSGLSTAAAEIYAGLSEENQLALAIQLSLQAQ